MGLRKIHCPIDSSFPEKKNFTTDYDVEIAAVTASSMPSVVITDSISVLKNARQMEIFTHTVTGRLGKFFEPVMEPLGFDWRVTTALMGAIRRQGSICLPDGCCICSGRS